MEEQIYAQVYEEISKGEKREGLWAKALAGSEGGGEAKAKSLYIKYRVQSLKDEANVAEAVTTAAEKTKVRDEEGEEKKKGGIVGVLLFMSIAILLIAASIVGVQEEASPAVEPNVQIDNPQVVAAVPEVSVVAEAIKEQVVLAPANPESEVSVVSGDAVVLAANQALLIMNFDKDCWVEIKDGNGKMILSDLYSAGDKIEQVVTAPIEVLLGRSSGVPLIMFNGQAIDLKPHTTKDIARFIVSN